MDASPGRLNASHIPVFYAAFNSDTVIKELHPNIGDIVAIGKFELMKEIKVFDFSIFDRKDHHQPNPHTRYSFIRDLCEEISRPITPDHKSLEYIPTQIIAEYLKEYFQVECIIYRSSLDPDLSLRNCNLAIFGQKIPFVDSNSTIESLMFLNEANIFYSKIVNISYIKSSY